MDDQNYDHLEPEDFYKELLKESKKIYESWIQSEPVKKRQISDNLKFSVCGTPIQKNKGIILGINWGGDIKKDEKKDVFHLQETMPDGLDIKDYFFIKRSKKYLEKYLGVEINPPSFNYANLCMFRTPRSSMLNSVDFELSLPVLKKYINYVSPPWILSLGSTNYELFKSLFEKVEATKITGGKFGVYKMELQKTPLFILPHPSAHLYKNDRDTIWENTFSQKLQQ